MHTEDGKDQEAAMSYSLANEVWRLRGIPMSPKVVLARLAERANEKHQAWPTIELLAGELGMSEATAMRAIVWLESNGFITRKRTRYSTLYTIITGKLGEVQACSGEDAPCTLQPETLHDDISDIAPCDVRPCMVQDRIVMNSQEPTKEPSEASASKGDLSEFKPRRKRKASRVPTRQELIDHGMASEHFRLLNVTLEVDKMLTWCAESDSPPSRLRLMNWLQKATPTGSTSHNGGSFSQSVTTEKDWAAECLPYDENSVVMDLSHLA